MAKNLTRNVLGFGLATLLISSLTGCASNQQIEISTSPVDKPDLILPNADTLNARPIKWVLVTEENSRQSFQDLDKRNKAPVFFSLDEDGYENLALNLSDIRALIQQQLTIIDAYRNYYLQSEEALKEANKRIEEMNRKIEKLNEESKESSLFNW